MEILDPQVNRSYGQYGFILPPHNNRMAMSIICTIVCCLVGGIIAIVYSAKSNELYTSATVASDDSLKQSLYLQSEQKNRTARTWIIISIIYLFLEVIFFILLVALGVLEDYL
ncbi:MAG: CD225/dispanin family protein [Bacteroidales bacterium]|nr:CD225/dispanin family protein [Bacteroidales bacterium]